MWMAYIGGYNPIIAIDQSEGKAKQLALRRKIEKFPDPSLNTWEEAMDYYGVWTEQIKNGTIIEEGL